MSATHRRLGWAARKRRWTRSAGVAADGSGDGGEHRLAPLHPRVSPLFSSTDGSARGRRSSPALHGLMHFEHPIHRIVLLVHGAQVGDQLLIADPLYRVRRTLRTRYPLLSSRQQTRLTAVFDDDNHLPVLIMWSVYQRLIAAYSHPDRRRAKTMMTTLIDSLRRGVPAGLEELAQLGRTLSRRRADILAYFDHHASNGPTEAINGRLEALRRNALGFRNLTHYRIRSLLHCGNLTRQIDAL
jgi:hypothetical protein